jgi:hypothetical protein
MFVEKNVCMVRKLEEMLDRCRDIAKIAVCSYSVRFFVGYGGEFIGGDFEKTVPFVLPFMDLTMGKISPYAIPYALGVMTNYSEKILNEINF